MLGRRFRSCDPGALGLPAYARATLVTVSQVRVVSSFPNVRSINVMKTAPLGLGTYALKSSLPRNASSRAPCSSTGSAIFHRGLVPQERDDPLGLGPSRKAR